MTLLDRRKKKKSLPATLRHVRKIKYKGKFKCKKKRLNFIATNLLLIFFSLSTFLSFPLFILFLSILFSSCVSLSSFLPHSLFSLVVSLYPLLSPNSLLSLLSLSLSTLLFLILFFLSLSLFLSSSSSLRLFYPSLPLPHSLFFLISSLCLCPPSPPPNSLFPLFSFLCLSLSLSFSS